MNKDVFFSFKPACPGVSFFCCNTRIMLSFSSSGIQFSQSLCSNLNAKLSIRTSPNTAILSDIRFNNSVAFICAAIGNCDLDAYASIALGGTLRTTSVGRYSAIGDFSLIGVSALDEQKVTTSAFTRSPFFCGAAATEEEQQYKKVTIGHDVWIGCHVCISESVTVGTGAIIGAGAIITKDVAPYAVVVGHNRQVRTRFSDEVCADLLESQWWRYDLPKMLSSGHDLPIKDPRACLEILKNTPAEDLLTIQDKWMQLHAVDANRCEVTPL